MNQLVSRNQAIHAAILARWRDAMRAVTALELADAAVHWARFVRALGAHARAEDEGVLPILARYPAPRGAAPEILDGEHRKLHALARAGHEAIATIASAAAEARRDAMIEALGPLLRVRNLFDHHSQRENELVYGTLAYELTNAERDAVRAILDESLAEVSTF